MTRAVTAVVAGALVALAATAVAVPAAADDVRLEGRGYGHGRGMSQYGAQGAATEHGKTYRQILRFYYSGLPLGRADGDVRVLVTADTSSDVVVADRSHLAVRSVGGQSHRLQRDGARRWRITPVDGGRRSRVSVLTGRWHAVRTLRGDAEVVAGGRPIRVLLPSGSVRYRGAVRSATPGDGSGRDTVNVVPLESYLRGVVPLEVPALWDPQAVRAQAVAARTYAAFLRADPAAAHYDLCDTSSCQVYGGADAEHPASDQAVRRTAHEVLVKDGRPAFTEFSASSGGWTVRGSRPYLRARRDPWDTFAGNPYRRWTVRLTGDQVSAAYPAVGRFRSLRVVERDGHGAWGGRALRVRVVGSQGSVTTTGDDVRVRLGLRSTWFRSIR